MIDLGGLFTAQIGGPLTLMVLAVIAVASAVVVVEWALTSRGRKFFDDLSEALRDANGKLLLAAARLGYSQTELSRLLNPRQQSFLTRLAEDEAVEWAILPRRLARMDDAHVQNLLEVSRHHRRMATMRGALDDQDRIA